MFGQGVGSFCVSGPLYSLFLAQNKNVQPQLKNTCFLPVLTEEDGNPTNVFHSLQIFYVWAEFKTEMICSWAQRKAPHHISPHWKRVGFRSLWPSNRSSATESVSWQRLAAVFPVPNPSRTGDTDHTCNSVRHRDQY